jgi:hypothetical protein
MTRYEKYIKAKYKILSVEIKAIEKSIRIANKTMNRRLQGMNEFRHQLDRQASEFITRRELMTFLVAEIALITLIVTIIIRFLE